jgi:hypothetical protein
MPEDPEAQATAAIVSAIKVGNYAANGVNFGNFKIKVVPASNFTEVWWTEPFIFGGPHGNPITFYRYKGNTAPYLPLGDVISLESKEAWYNNHGIPCPLPGGGVMLFAPGDDNPEIFAHPDGFTWILDDAGSHNSSDMSYFRMNPPPGYAALGICFGKEWPDRNNYWCIKKKYLQAVASVEVWSDEDAGWTHYDGRLHAPTFGQMPDPPPTADPPRNDIFILPPTYLSVQDLINEPAYALVGQQAMLPVLPFDPPDPPDDPKIVSGATTTYGLGPVAIVPYTAVPADAGYPDQAIESPFYFIASEPYWECTQSLPTKGGGTQEVDIIIGVSQTQASSFTETTSMTIGCEVGAKFGGVSSKVTTSFTHAFSLTTQESATHSSSTEIKTSVNFPAQPVTWIWDRQTQVAVFRNDQRQVGVASYGNRDQRFIPSGAVVLGRLVKD